MRLFRHKLTIGLLLTLLTFGAFPNAFATHAFSHPEVNKEVKTASSDLKAEAEFEFASIEANVHRLELELAKFSFFGGKKTVSVCLRRAAAVAFPCAVGGFLAAGWLGAAAGAAICGTLGYLAC